MLNESLEKAVHDLGFSRKDLMEALRKSSSVQSIILLPLIKTVSEALRDTETLLNAILADTKEEEA